MTGLSWREGGGKSGSEPGGGQVLGGRMTGHRRGTSCRMSLRESRSGSLEAGQMEDRNSHRGPDPDGGQQARWRAGTH